MAIGQSDLRIVIEAQNKTQAAFGQLNASLNNLKTVAIGAGAAVAAALAGAVARDIVDSTRQLGNQIDLLRDNLGLTADEASRLNYAARVVGSSAEEVSQSFGILNRKLIEQIPLIAKGESDFHKWGVAVQDAKGEIMPFTQVFENVRKRLSELPAGFERSGLAMDLMGRSGRELIDLMTLTDAQFAEMAREAQEMGLILSEAGVDSLEEFNRNLNRLDLQMDSIKLQIGSFLVPLLGKVLGAFRAAAGAAKAFGEALRTPLGILKEVVGRIGTFIAQIKEQGFLNAVASLAGDLVSKVGEALGGVGAWLAENWPKWRKGLGDLFDNAVAWIRTIGWSTIVTFMETKVPEFANWIVKSLPEWTKNATALIADFIQWWVGTGVPTIVQGFSTATSKIGEWLLGAIGWMSHTGMPAAQSTLLSIGLGILTGIVKGLGDLIGKIAPWFLDAIGWVSNVGIPGALSTLGAIGGAILGGIVNGLGDLKTKIWNWIKEAIPMAADIEAIIRGRLPGGGGDPGLNQPGGPIGPPAAPTTPVLPQFPGLNQIIPPKKTGDGNVAGVDRYGNPGFWTPGLEFIAAASGFHGIVNKPTMFMAGEAGAESVDITPGGRGGAGSGVTVNVSVGSVDSSDRVRELANAVSAEIMRAMGASGNIWARRGIS